MVTYGDHFRCRIESGNVTACMDMGGYDGRNTTRIALEIRDENRANLLDLTIIEIDK